MAIRVGRRVASLLVVGRATRDGGSMSVIAVTLLVALAALSLLGCRAAEAPVSQPAAQTEAAPTAQVQSDYPDFALLGQQLMTTDVMTRGETGATTVERWLFLLQAPGEPGLLLRSVYVRIESDDDLSDDPWTRLDTVFSGDAVDDDVAAALLMQFYADHPGEVCQGGYELESQDGGRLFKLGTYIEQRNGMLFHAAETEYAYLYDPRIGGCEQVTGVDDTDRRWGLLLPELP